MKVIIAGGSGLVGQRLTQHLEQKGAEVLWLSRNQNLDRSVYWDPARGEIDIEALESCYAVVNLAGAGIADERWSEERKQLILDSRVQSTELLVQTIGKLKSKPRVLVNASAHGIYQQGLEKPCNEGGPHGDNFLAEVCKAWEAAAKSVTKLGVRLAIIRISVVLDPDGGALAKMLPPFKMGAGGPAGSGKQMMSWIHRDDLVAILHQAITNDAYTGVINAVALRPISNADFGKTLGKVLKRPAFTPAPTFALKIAFGEMAEQTILADLGVVSSKLPELQFSWKYPDLEGALRELLEKA